MPSRHAHRAALKRISEPAVIPPAGLAELPTLLGRSTGWRNRVIGDDYDRTLWEAYLVVPGSSRVLAEVRLIDGVFGVSAGNAFAQVQDPQAAFELAAGWAMARFTP